MTNKSILSILLSLLLIITLFSSCHKDEFSSYDKEEYSSYDNEEISSYHKEEVTNQTTTLHISPTLCQPMTGGMTPTRFCDTEGQGTFLEKKFVQAYVDDDGCLILTLENDIINEWKNTFFPMQVLQCVLGDSRDIGITIDYSKDFLYFMVDARSCGFEISEDFTKIIASPDDNHWYFPLITMACAIQLVFEGKNCTEAKVTYVDVDDAGEIIEITVFPDDTGN